MISGTTRLYAIIGDPITHVRTPTSFNERFAARGIDAVCVPLQVPVETFDTCLAGLKALPNLDGLIVTAPHKASVMAFCDVIEPGAQRVGAVNTIRRLADGRYGGTILDGYGFVEGLRHRGHEPRGKSVFIVGAGGAASAIAFALVEAGVRDITFRDRTPARALDLAARVAAAPGGCRADVGRPAREFDIVLNATPLGLEPDDPLPARIDELRPGTLVADVIMKPATTAFLADAKAAGFAIHHGQNMLDQQLDLMFAFLGLDEAPARGAA